ncbi:unnamed protein product [Schistosoma mattheei]|uniref:ELP1 alpha-solenoid domain-containing protein n=1 Tax=Schistosoma mattheei TaxID=31246 RepID=A0A3P8CB28_9TREM|nr:unnamed protein product [Schistosoma mattheei]
MYKVALGTYDLNFATIMAQRTQLDPKEYLAELNELNSITNDLKKYQCDTMEEAIAYQQFKIDHSLKKYSKALNYIWSTNKTFHSYDRFIRYLFLLDTVLDSPLPPTRLKCLTFPFHLLNFINNTPTARR